jgi:hypothetical protein
MTIFNLSEKIFKNFSQSEAIMSPGSHVGWLIGTKVTPLGQTMQRNIPAKLCKTNFFSRTIGWIGTILGRNVPCKVLIKCCYFLF